MLAAIFHSPNIISRRKNLPKSKNGILTRVTACAVCGYDERVLETDIK